MKIAKFYLLYLCVIHFFSVSFCLTYLSELFLSGLDSFTNHASYSLVCLSRDVIWTALVSLHDRESVAFYTLTQQRH